MVPIAVLIPLDNYTRMIFPERGIGNWQTLLPNCDLGFFTNFVHFFGSIGVVDLPITITLRSKKLFGIRN